MYGYVGGNPTNAVDPSGLGPLKYFFRTMRGKIKSFSGGERMVAKHLAEKGGNFIIEGGTKNNREKAAKRISERAWGKDNVVKHPSHGSAGEGLPMDHSQPCDRRIVNKKGRGQGHIYYGFAPVIYVPFASIGEDVFGDGLGTILDFFNPFSDIAFAQELLGQPVADIGYELGDLYYRIFEDTYEDPFYVEHQPQFDPNWLK